MPSQALADRFEASRIFTACALLGALFNALFAFAADGLMRGLPLRFAVGFCLAGVYPLGMKLVVSWVPERAGTALAQLVGMLTLGSAPPHGVRLAGADLVLAIYPTGFQHTCLYRSLHGLAPGDGPHLRRTPGTHHLRLGRVLTAFTDPAISEPLRWATLAISGNSMSFWTLTPRPGHRRRPGRPWYTIAFRAVLPDYRYRQPRLCFGWLVEPIYR